jgi:UDP-N-acetyl-D-mannosaminuronate dehydrogenase
MICLAYYLCDGIFLCKQKNRIELLDFYSVIKGVVSMKTVTVVGLGKIGLPLAANFANSEHFHVIGADKNEKVIEAINKEVSHIQNEPGLVQLLNGAWKFGTLHATTNTTKALSRVEKYS